MVQIIRKLFRLHLPSVEFYTKEYENREKKM